MMGRVKRRRIMHLFINLPASDIDILIETPFSLNVELQRYLAPYPERVRLPVNSSEEAVVGWWIEDSEGEAILATNGSVMREPSA